MILKYFDKNNISMMLNKCLIQRFWVDVTKKPQKYEMEQDLAAVLTFSSFGLCYDRIGYFATAHHLDKQNAK